MNRLAPRALASLLAVAAVAVPVAGCGSAKKEAAASPLDNALGYVPADSPLVLSFETDPNGGQFRAAKKIVKKFPFAGLLEQQLQTRLKSQSANYDRDLKPLLGNEFVVGATSVKSIAADNAKKDFVGAIQAKDGKKLEAAVEKEKAKQDGEKDGAKIYKGKDGNAFAIKDDVLIVAGTRALLDEALANRGSDDRFTEGDLDKGTEGLPKDSAFRLFTDLQKVIAADPDTADARKVKWVKALRGFGLSASVVDDKVDVDFNLATDPNGLTEADLPIASGDQSPGVVKRAGQIGFGLRDLGQLVKFGESAAQAVDPAQFGSYETAKKTIERRLKLDVQKDVFDQLDGDASISVSPRGGKASVKAEVKDPAAFKATLAKVTNVLPAIIGNSSGATPKIRRSRGIYSASTSKGKIAYGLVGDSFVFSDTAAAARRIASASPEKVPGAEGSVAIQADAEQLVTRALGRFSRSGRARQDPGLGLGAALGGALFAGPLDDLTGSVKADREGITGKLSLSFD